MATLPYCKRHFKNPGGLTKHARTFHADRLPQAQAPSYSGHRAESSPSSLDPEDQDDDALPDLPLYSEDSPLARADLSPWMQDDEGSPFTHNHSDSEHGYEEENEDLGGPGGIDETGQQEDQVCTTEIPHPFIHGLFQLFTLKNSTEICAGLGGQPCDELGNDVPLDSVPPIATSRADNDYFPFTD